MPVYTFVNGLQYQ